MVLSGHFVPSSIFEICINSGNVSALIDIGFQLLIAWDDAEEVISVVSILSDFGTDYLLSGNCAPLD